MQKMKVLKALLHQARADALEGNMAAHATRARASRPDQSPLTLRLLQENIREHPWPFSLTLFITKKSFSSFDMRCAERHRLNNIRESVLRPCYLGAASI